MSHVLCAPHSLRTFASASLIGAALLAPAMPAAADSALLQAAKTALEEARNSAADTHAPELITFNDLDTIEDLLSGYGSVERDIDGDDVVMFRGRMVGKTYSLYFFGCDGTTDCNNATFVAYFDTEDYPVTSETLNSFNNDYRFGKASVDADGDLEVNFSFTFLGGLPRTALDDTFDWWQVVLKGVEEHFG